MRVAGDAVDHFPYNYLTVFLCLCAQDGSVLSGLAAVILPGSVPKGHACRRAHGREMTSPAGEFALGFPILFFLLLDGFRRLRLFYVSFFPGQK